MEGGPQRGQTGKQLLKAFHHQFHNLKGCGNTDKHERSTAETNRQRFTAQAIHQIKFQT